MKLNSLVKRKILYSISELPQNSKIAIYGSGIIGRGFKSLIEKSRNDVIITCFINTFIDGNIDNLEVISLSEIDRKKGYIDMIIICSSHWNEIEDELINIGLDFCIISNELIYNTSELKGLGSFRFYANERKNVENRLENLLPYFDKESIKDFKMLMNLRLKESEIDIFSFFKNVQQRFTLPYIDNINLNNKSIIIEGGVEDGSDSVNFYNSFKEANIKIYGFEPFIEVFNASQNNSFLIEKGIEVYPWALWNINEDLSFNKNELSTVSSCINRNEVCTNITKNESIVRGIKIDSFVEEYNIETVSLIKLDIEGAEVEALNGAAKTIEKYLPQLAISIYHKKEHLYEIPEFILRINPNYKFKLGFYSPTFIDAVLYAII